MSRTSRDTVGAVAMIGAIICLLVAIVAIPIGVIWGATHGGLTAEGIVSGLVAWAVCEGGGIIGFFLLGGTSAISIGGGRQRY